MPYLTRPAGSRRRRQCLPHSFRFISSADRPRTFVAEAVEGRDGLALVVPAQQPHLGRELREGGTCQPLRRSTTLPLEGATNAGRTQALSSSKYSITSHEKAPRSVQYKRLARLLRVSRARSTLRQPHRRSRRGTRAARLALSASTKATRQQCGAKPSQSSGISPHLGARRQSRGPGRPAAASGRRTGRARLR
jgi:hypothetical protein